MRKRRMNLFIEYILGCIERALSFANMIPLEAPLIYANCDTNGVKGFSTNDLSEESVSRASLIPSLPRVSKHITAPPISPRVQASPHTSTRGRSLQMICSSLTLKRLGRWESSVEIDQYGFSIAPNEDLLWRNSRYALDRHRGCWRMRSGFSINTTFYK